MPNIAPLRRSIRMTRPTFIIGLHARIERSAKPLYHAAAVFASNYLVGILAVAERLAVDAGAPPEAARAALLDLALRLGAAMHDDRPAPDVDLLIRTGGGRRLSDFLLWVCAYAELWFTATAWPEFTGARWPLQWPISRDESAASVDYGRPRCRLQRVDT